MTLEQLEKLEAERKERAEKERLRLAEVERQRKEADAKADELLRKHLSLRQRRQYRRNRSFCVRARDGTQFRIKHGWAGNIEELNAAGKPVNRFCIHPVDSVPYADNLLAQKLLLETDPDKFRKIANRTAIPQAV
jgi:hypothetical protein